ncbi:hypothetical protein [Streptomyces sp. NPDC002994]|uniref:hypothetical protein n=1 Tax=Streptomyces sp. NPDC002994 TaxID=3154441 RepID=UPI0033B47F47
MWAAVRAFRSTERPPAAALVAGLAAAACTAYSGDTSWRYAGNRLGMVDTTERAAMFAAAELALFACVLMARANLRGDKGAPGAPGLLVWGITSVQIIPAYSESGFWGGTVRAVLGPVLAALLWHLALDVDLRHAKPEATSNGLAAMVGRELRERLLSRLGLAVRDRSAEQITRDRWTARAVDLAARLADRSDGWRTRRMRRQLSVAVGRAQVGAHPQQRRALLQLLSARLHSGALSTLDLPSPWEFREPVTPPRPATVVAYEQLREMQPIDATLAVASAHPDLDAAGVRAILMDHGVIVSETAVTFALRSSASVHPRALASASAAGQTLFKVHARIDDEPAPDAPEGAPDAQDADLPDAAADLALLPDAQRVEQVHRAQHDRPASLRVLQKQLRIGQPRAQRMRALLDADGSPS